MSVPDFSEALRVLQSDGLVAYPTETLWGLGVNSWSKTAMEKLCCWKGRDQAQSVSVLVPGMDSLAGLGLSVTDDALLLADAFWPGPLTLILKVGENRFAPGVVHESGTVGLRCSPHPVAMSLARLALQAGLGPVTTTSLNLHGEAPACSRREALRLSSSGETPVLLLEGEVSGAGKASTVVDLAGEGISVLREGVLPESEIRRVLERGAP